MMGVQRLRSNRRNLVLKKFEGKTGSVLIVVEIYHLKS